MDFTADPAQQAVADVVTSVLDRDNSWNALVAGGVTALPVPERVGGDGVGLPEIATALTEIGRHGLIGPALATLGFGGTGAHYCIGANLARMTINLIFNAVADHMPDLSSISEPERLRSGWLNGIKHWEVSYTGKSPVTS